MSQSPPPTYDPTQPPPPLEPERSSGMAIAALILGIVGMCVVPLGLVGLILGIVALSQIGDPIRRLTGRGMAITGIVTGAIGLILIPVFALMIGIMLPALGAARRTARQMQNNTQVRGIQQALVMHAQGNGNFYPGLDANGNPVDLTVEGRYQVLLDANYFAGDYMISPSETNKTEWVAGQVTSANYSYAMLDVSDPGGRRDEWKETLNSEAVVISDRNTGQGGAVQSIHTNTPGDWRGSVAWNDNHVNFETYELVDTKYGNGAPNVDDDLFQSTGTDDALMIDTGD